MHGNRKWAEGAKGNMSNTTTDTVAKEVAPEHEHDFVTACFDCGTIVSSDAALQLAWERGRDASAEVAREYRDTETFNEAAVAQARYIESAIRALQYDAAIPVGVEVGERK
jgi:hypothetical protein